MLYIYLGVTEGLYHKLERFYFLHRRNLKKMRGALDDQVELLTQPVFDALIQMIDSVVNLNKG